MILQLHDNLIYLVNNEYLINIKFKTWQLHSLKCWIDSGFKITKYLELHY